MEEAADANRDARAGIAARPPLKLPGPPDKLIVPTGIGSATDVIVRLMADNVARGLGQSVIVENMPPARSA